MLLLLGVIAGATCVQPGSGLRDVRPSLSGPERTLASDDGTFLLHYTDEGADAPVGGDADGDGVPDMLDRVLAGLAIGKTAYEGLGYNPLVLDDGDGGSEAIDVYLVQIDAFGYARSTDTADGLDNSCYMRLDPDLGGQGGQFVESVAVHELHHCVQFTYTTDVDSWMYEATATWEQYRTVMDDALLALVGILYGERLSQPEVPIDYRGGRYEYAGMLVMKWWEEYGGADTGRVPALWQALAVDPDWRVAMGAEAERLWGLSLAEAFLEHATWNGFACARDDGQHYDEDVVPCAFPSTVPVEVLAGDAPVFHVELPETQYTAAYAEIPADALGWPIEVTCDPVGAGAELGVRLVALDPDGVAGEETSVWVGEDRGTGRLRFENPEGSFLAVFASTGAAGVEATCTFVRVEPEVEPRSCGCTGVSGGPVAWLAIPLLVAVRRRGRVVQGR